MRFGGKDTRLFVPSRDACPQIDVESLKTFLNEIPVLPTSYGNQIVSAEHSIN